jgi:hypothetical protein
MKEFDPRGLIAEAYRIDGISGAECRSIFFDWALSVEGEAAPAVAGLLAHYGPSAPDHPMTAVLREGVERKALAPAGRARNRRRSR